MSGWTVPDLDVHDSDLMWAATMAASQPPTYPLLEAIERQEHKLNFREREPIPGRHVQVVAVDLSSQFDVRE
ncbi:hypothetical protein [Rhodococcus globerulus]|uniref:hypothetical protein n=1 Tax=Rhodococcus globerulus TaxID=33008 RepID=UPI003016F8AD